ncbi:MAG TPA: LysR substrate-binding domain-containing protein, partial [Azospirillaceae bacterium]|nr:LysR substrate-binding domain-containing protein [Azospirillaceae bacterium]
FVESFGPAIIDRVGREAPGVRLRFVQKADRDSKPLRDGAVDLETGVVGPAAGPELRAQALFTDRFVAVVRPGGAYDVHALDLPGYLAARHVGVSRLPGGGGPVDEALQRLGARRDIAVSVSGYSAALALVRAADLVATVPEKHTAGLRDGLRRVALPFSVAEITISLIWHPRMNADPAHRWLRAQVRCACA